MYPVFGISTLELPAQTLETSYSAELSCGPRNVHSSYGVGAAGGQYTILGGDKRTAFGGDKPDNQWFCIYQEHCSFPYPAVPLLTSTLGKGVSGRQTISNAFHNQGVIL
jgi:hypothetical protein